MWGSFSSCGGDGGGWGLCSFARVGLRKDMGPPTWVTSVPGEVRYRRMDLRGMDGIVWGVWVLNLSGNAVH